MQQHVVWTHCSRGPLISLRRQIINVQKSSRNSAPIPAGLHKGMNTTTHTDCRQTQSDKTHPHTQAWTHSTYTAHTAHTVPFHNECDNGESSIPPPCVYEWNYMRNERREEDAEKERMKWAQWVFHKVYGLYTQELLSQNIQETVQERMGERNDMIIYWYPPPSTLHPQNLVHPGLT